jgi:hypothetical protein
VVVGDGPWFVAQALWEDTPNDPSHPDGLDGITTYTVVEDQGVLKIARAVILQMPVE